ncbi:MAG: protein kinase [Pseudomonadota bacterium]
MSAPSTKHLQQEREAIQAVERALEKDPANPRGWLERQPLADYVRRRALTLLARVASLDAQAEPPPPVLHSMPVPPGMRIGDYTVEHLLGRGGMGSVYLAHRQHEGVLQRVALKLLNQSLSPAGRQRFLVEQQALARLHHPFIAGFVDVGTTADGIHYFAMEYIEGEEICAYCDRQQLSVEERIQLWLRVSDAVRSSHRQLIIHRDIKPSNVLVSEGAVPKLIDFGVAKILGEQDAELTMAFGAQLTLDYASPERITQGESSTAEDQYALAVLLYELVAGARPFQRTSSNMTELLRQVSQEQAPELAKQFDRESEGDRRRLAAARGSSVKSLRRVLSSDLNAILQRALACDDTQRYTSIDAMTTDLERYQRGEPVSARPSSLGYRLHRFVGRHKVGVSVAVFVLSVVLVSFLVVVEQVRESQRQLARSNAVATFMSDIFKAPSNRWSSTLRLGVNATMRDALLAASEHLRNTNDLPAAVQVELMVALAESLSIWGLGEQAVAQARAATVMAQAQLPESHPMRELSYINMSIVSNIHGTPEALAEAPKFAQASIEWLHTYDPTNYARLASSVGDLGYNKAQLGEHAAAIEYYEQGFDYWRAARGPDVHPLRALALGLLGYSALQVNDLDKAHTALAESFRVYEILGGAPIAEWTITYPWLAALEMARGEYDEAARVVERTLAVGERDPADNPSEYRSRALAVLMYRQLGRDDAADQLSQTLAEDPKAPADDPVYGLCLTLARVLRAVVVGEVDDARASLRALADQPVQEAPWYLHVSYLTLYEAAFADTGEDLSSVRETLAGLVAKHALEGSFLADHPRLP